jgi:hypothetical protein
LNIRKISYSFALVAMFAFAGTAAAQGPVIDTDTTTSELEMTAEVQTALQLNISTGTGGAAVAPGAAGLFTIDFGFVNGLGVGTPASGVTVSVDGTGALYKTPINLTPVFSGYNGETASVSVIAELGGNNALAREGSGSISSASTVASSHAAFAGAISGSENERFVGFYIPRTEVAGNKTATLIYTVTMAID